MFTTQGHLMKRFIKLLISTALIFVAVSGLVMPIAYAGFTDYDCKGQPNGNYNHPYDCDKFITCSNGYAYEMDCADCNISEGSEHCPDGKLHYYKPLDRCEWANIAQCKPTEPTSFFNNPFKSTVVSSIFTTGNRGKHCIMTLC
ncbi:chitin binding domain-containing protein [Plectonema radiosum NIES-515]|uniref:Chitin binding domain-containing protein n=1 Tax=Plectonema radiosum NIES-515 TaxID=2986073 RepID=A0ABT3AUU3_9CYAN|nr:chitin binding peritrophin-A domain-containing protein [Plectonema radiosum]MCV3212868.1 chitin binding domain-containing protein [Plectonema radiosum NIES-515]